MIEPELAPVTPRVIWPETGDAVPIDEIFRRMEGKPTGAIEIVGSSGSGKTTALRHLAAEASKDREIVWADDAKPEEVTSRMRECWVVYTSTAHISPITASSFQLTGWGEDERIEYLLTAHPARCQSVIVRLGATDDRWAIGDSPTLWRIVLDEMAEHTSIRSVDDALWRRVMQVLPEGSNRRLAEEHCFGRFAPRTAIAEGDFQRFFKLCDAEALRLLRLPRIRMLLAAEYLARRLEAKQSDQLLLSPRITADRAEAVLVDAAKALEVSLLRLPQELVLRTAQQVAKSPLALDRLREILAGEESHLHPMAASILHATGTGWIPDGKSKLYLECACFPRAIWLGADLRKMWMKAVDLSGSSLARAQLDGIQAGRASFRGASLAEASLEKIVASDADFTDADLSHANLQGANLVRARLPQARLCSANLEGATLAAADVRGASLVGATLRHARLSDTRVDGADITSANLEDAFLQGLDLRKVVLDDACLAGANLGRCNLEGMRLTGVDFTAAELSNALLSGSVMQGGTLRLANLQGAGLADVQWENADLRTADLRGAVFHLGSSRSGLVDSPLASEGTRTGFYTDDFDQQSFQAPEQIRKANLCGTDLRGAKVDGVDFYLVDLRGAKYDADQLEHFRRCRAILTDPE